MALNFDDYNQQMARIQGQIAALKSQPTVPYVAQPLQPSPPPPKQLNQAKGIEGAIKFQNDLSPGSNDVVFDEDTDHFYLISKDEDGSTPTKIRRYSFTLDEEIETTPKFYVYEWYNTETGEIFYVGKGCRKRKGQISKRNKLFKEYYDSNPCKSRIVKKFWSEKDAFEYEKKRILELKAIGQAKCNLDYGGSGGCHFVWTDEMRQYVSDYNIMKQPEQRERMSINNPMKDPRVSYVVREKNKRPLWIGDIKYKGLIDAAEEYGVTSTAVLYWIQRGYSRDEKACYYDGEQKPQLIILKQRNTRSVVIDGIEYESITQAAKEIGGDEGALSRALRENRTFKGHICKYAG